jgi:hypothetical protein
VGEHAEGEGVVRWIQRYGLMVGWKIQANCNIILSEAKDLPKLSQRAVLLNNNLQSTGDLADSSPLRLAQNDRR